MHDPEDDLLDLEDEHKPFWTTRRIILTVIVLITIIAFLVYSFSGLFLEPPPPPPPIRPLPLA
jgi:quinol-cytochrome oxidoreductase complex cytochrome b subunit